jgi:hypothetical protein
MNRVTPRSRPQRQIAFAFTSENSTDPFRRSHVGLSSQCGSSRSLKSATTSSAASDEIRASNRGSRRSMRPELPSLTIAHPYPQRHCSLMRAAAQALPGRQLIPLPGPLFSLGLEHRPSHDGVGRFGLPMLQAESAEIGALRPPAQLDGPPSTKKLRCPNPNG